MIKKIYPITFTLFICNALIGADYWVNNNTGSDSNAGDAPTRAWKTINKVNTKTFQPGDKVYFQSGVVWTVNTSTTLHARGSGTGTSKIQMRKWGSGANPTIKGSSESSGRNAIFSNQSHWKVQNMCFEKSFRGFTVLANNQIANGMQFIGNQFKDCGWADGTGNASRGLDSSGIEMRNLLVRNNFGDGTTRTIFLNAGRNLNEVIDNNDSTGGGSGIFFNKFTFSGEAKYNKCIDTDPASPVKWVTGARLADNDGYTVKNNNFEKVYRGSGASQSLDGCGFDFEQLNDNILYENNHTKNTDGCGVMVIKEDQENITIKNCNIYRPANNYNQVWRNTCVYVKKTGNRNTGSIQGGTWTLGNADHYFIDQNLDSPTSWGSQPWTYSGVTEQ